MELLRKYLFLITIYIHYHFSSLSPHRESVIAFAKHCGKISLHCWLGLFSYAGYFLHLIVLFVIFFVCLVRSIALPLLHFL